MTVRDVRDGALDRSAHERAVPGLIDDARADPATRVLVVAGDAAPLAGPDRLHWVAADAAPHGAEWGFIGRASDGAALLAAAVEPAELDPFDAPQGWAGLRTAGGALAGEDADAFVAAVSLGRWLREAPHCPACGARCDVENAGWSRRCPGCAREHFPRTDPAVIVAVTSATDAERVLLGSNALWSADRFSCFAGFAEAGESLEAAVHREVREESGVDVVDVRYRGSQAWPYPRSLMLGFFATAVDDDAALADGEEIAAVRWFTRDEVGDALAGRSEILLPGPASIAHRLISGWHGGRS
ncbi:NAD(+) diphosphatase [Microbacterium sp. NPDC055910]|uniref:NAD(+) diphosphatase n=1 Tax=Microbacterium sp. NPDC055910 TaxID=3345659 RepID=UPI0035D69D3A